MEQAEGYAGHVVVYNRWASPFACYLKYEQLLRGQVSYITTRAGVHGVPPGRVTPLDTSGELVATAGDIDLVAAALRSIAEQHGPVHRLVALHEGDLEMAAELRERFGLPGDTREEVAVYRDKLAAIPLLEAAGLPVPATELVTGADQLTSFGESSGWPVMVKPRRGTASAGVAVLADAAAARRWQPLAEGEFICQPFVGLPIVHLDGYFDGQDAPLLRASRYINDCLAYEALRPLGSVEIDDAVVVRRLRAVALAVLRSLGARPMVFHLELFSDDSAERTIFLEIGARVGGAEIPYLWREVHGLDLVEIAFRLQIGLPVTGAGPAGREDVGGWLLVPPAIGRPCHVTEVALADGHGSYAQVLPAVGQNFPDVGGYELTGARFRFRGSSHDEVRAAILRTEASLTLRCAPGLAARDTLILLGVGGRAYREYSLAVAAQKADVVLLDPAETSWQLPYLAASQVVDRDDLARAVAQASAHRPGGGARLGILTWDEPMVELAARTSEQLGVPGIGADAAATCRDKLRARRALASAGIPSAAFYEVSDESDLAAAAAALGFPVIVKPRGLAGSTGVEVARSPADLPSAYRNAVAARYPGLAELGVIVEEYLDGDEVSADCVVRQGELAFVSVARKRLGFWPHFEEVGHLVSPWEAEPWARGLRDMLAVTHRAVGVRDGVTHAELRLTGAGPRLVELNARLGGDFIPMLGQVATGVDLVAAAVDVALGRPPHLSPDRCRCAEVAFAYPPQDCVVVSVDTSAAAAVPGIVLAVPLAAPGAVLRLPPRGVVPRLAAVIAEAPTADQASTVLAEAMSLIDARYEPTPDAADPCLTATARS